MKNTLVSWRSQVSERMGTARAFVDWLRQEAWFPVLAIVFSGLSLWRDEGPTDRQPPLLSDVAGWLPPLAWAVLATVFVMVLMLEWANDTRHQPSPYFEPQWSNEEIDLGAFIDANQEEVPLVTPPAD